MTDSIELIVRGSYAYICEVRATEHEWNSDLQPPPLASTQNAGNQPSPWLVGGFVGIELGKRVQPLSEPDLHRQFGRLKPTRKVIKQFADRWGLLEDGDFLVYLEQGQPQAAQFGESLQFWKREIEMMDALLDLWEYILHYKNKPDGFDIVWHHQPERISLVWRFPGGGYTLHSIAHEGIFSEKQLIEQIRKGAISSARSYLQERLQERLRGHLHPIFHYYGAKHILMVPDSLLSALYLSFALEVDEQAEPKALCKCGCGRDFPPGHGRKFYDEDCKKRDWWRRKRGKEKGA